MNAMADFLRGICCKALMKEQPFLPSPSTFFTWVHGTCDRLQECKVLFGSLLVREQCRATSMNPAERNWLPGKSSHFILDYCLCLLKAIATTMVNISLSSGSSGRKKPGTILYLGRMSISKGRDFRHKLGMFKSYIMKQKPQENLRKYEFNLNILSFIRQSLYKNSTLSFIQFSAFNVRG